MTSALISGTFTGTGQSKSAFVYGPFNFSVWGTPLNGDGTADTYSGTVELERSFDGGTTWLAVAEDGTGTPASYTTIVSLVGKETESAVLYRVNCTAYSSGTINYRLSQSWPPIWPRDVST